MSDISFVDISSDTVSDNIEILFPGWRNQGERVCVFSPHDDDGIIGAGYAIQAAVRKNAEVFIFIFCRGNAGYSSVEQKQGIEGIRENETKKAYSCIGVKSENIVRFDYSDFSVISNIGWCLENGKNSSFKNVITKLRQLKITRVLIPNAYREHVDHLAVNIIGSYDSPQAGDPILVDWGEPHAVKSVLEYSVWADLSPEDALVSGRILKLRANRLIVVSEELEKAVCKGIAEYKSQGEIIKGLIESRTERRINNSKFLEVYIQLDPRPKLDYSAYIDYIQELEAGT